MPTYLPVQDGYLYPSGPPFNGTDAFIDDSTELFVLGSGGPIGLIFELPLGRITTAASLSLFMFESFIGETVGTFHLRARQILNPPDYSSADRPLPVGPILDSVDFPLSAVIHPTFTIPPSLLNNYAIAGEGWTGRIAFAIHMTSGADGVSRTFPSSRSNMNQPVLTTTELEVPVRRKNLSAIRSVDPPYYGR